ncbi:MAG: lamin tail domain-containing protein [Marinoscillum sp.]|uniref:lamin tail domain-containing protein n=1 Tax=Marinoscillum sp. TaxID=2024838 RepID=UPI0032F1D85F
MTLLKTKIILVMLLAFYTSSAQLSINSLDTDHTIDFDNTLLGVNLGPLQGIGLVSLPVTLGQLDSRAWAIFGMSDGDVNFNGTGVLGDFTGGISQGGVLLSGLYAFNTGTILSPDYALGFQADDTDMTPGSLRLKLQNDIAATTIRTVTVSYDVYVYNDQNASSAINLAFSADNTTYETVRFKKVSTPTTADVSPEWVKYSVTKTIYGLSWASGSHFYLSWQFDDESGIGARDEFAIDNIVVNVGNTHPEILITEIMYDPNSTEPDYEWVEIYNNTANPIDLEGFVLFDNSGSAGNTPISGSYILAPNEGVILIDQNITNIDFQAAWGTGNSVPTLIVNLPDLSNTGMSLGLWGNSAYYDSGNLTNAMDVVSYQNGTGSWPAVSSSEGKSIYLTSLESDNNTGSSWAKSSDGANTPSGYTYGIPAQGVGSGSDIGSPYAGASALPVTWLSIEVVLPDSQRPKISWSTAQEINNEWFHVEKSFNGEDWSVIGQLAGKGTYKGVSSYTYEDLPLTRSCYYRIRQIDYDGKWEHSEIRHIVPSQSSRTKIYPTLLENGNRTLSIENLLPGVATSITMYTPEGKLAFQTHLIPESTATNLQLPQYLINGTHLINISAPAGLLHKSRIVLR